MRAKANKKLASFILALIILFISAPVDAKGNNNDGIDAFIVLDNSGSMKVNDSDNLRFEAIVNFIHMLNIDDSIGVIKFNTETDIELPLSEIKSENHRKFLMEQIKVTLPSKDTDVYAALLRAFGEMNSSLLPNHTQFFIFLTDGIIDPGPDYKENDELRNKYYKQLDKLVSEYENNIWPIFVVFLNPAGEEDDYLKEIAQRTGGKFYSPENAGRLTNIFDDILKNINDIKGQVAKAVETKRSQDKGKDSYLTVDIISPDSGKYYYNEKMNIESRILVNGKRSTQDRSIIVDYFTVDIVDPENNLHNVELNDQGSKGDVKKGDGIYSSAFVPDKKGKYKFGFKAAGGYNGKQFKNTGYIDIDILSPSIIKINNEVSEIFSVMQGKKLQVNLDFSSDINSKYIIEFLSASQSDIKVKSIKTAVFPGDPARIVLKIPIPRHANVGEHKIVLLINTFSQGVKVEPEEIILNIKVLPYKFFLSNQLMLYILLAVVCVGFSIYGYLIFIRYKEKSMRTVKGNIICYKKDKKIEKIDLSSLKKQRLTISSDMQHEPDVFIACNVYEKCTESFIFHIYTHIEQIKTPSRFRVGYIPRYFVEAGMRSKLLINGLDKKISELTNGDSFDIGGYSFVYLNPKAKIKVGRNVLSKFDNTL